MKPHPIKNIFAMRNIYFSVVISFLSGSTAIAQNIGINATGATPHTSAMLDISSTNSGLLVPRVALTATDVASPVASPATSLLVYNTATAGTSPNNVVPGYYYWSGTAWVPFSTASNTGWSLTGNSGTTASNFIGTTDATDLIFNTNNAEAMRLTSSGEVGIGSTDADVKLLVDAGTSSYNTGISAIGTLNDYLEINVQNFSNGNLASSDIVATANNGTDNSKYVDMGINSAGYSNGNSNILNGSNLAYLYSNADNLKIGNGTPGKSLIFFTNPSSGTLGTSTANGEERMTINGDGKITIAKDLQLSGAFMPGNNAGTSGYLLTSAGAGSPPTWTDPANGSFWTLDGNNITVLKSLGTTSNKDLPFITNNTERMRISNTGNLAIGTSSFNGTNPEKFLVNAGTTTSVNAIVGKGSIDSYLQLNIQNQSSGTSVSSDVVATANNGSETTNYVDMGINGGSYTGGVMGAANDAYLYNVGQNLLIGTGSASKSLVFMTGGTSQATNERMRIDGSGRVGIGNTNPTSTLSVTGSIAMAYRSGTGAYTVLATDHIVINTGGAATWTLPAASTCAGRVYRLINQGSGNITLSQSVRTDNATTTTTLGTAAGSNFYEILSDGTEWRRIN